MPLPSLSSRKIILLFILLEIGLLLLSYFQNGANLLALQAAARYAGLLSLIVFSFIFMLFHKPEVIRTWLSEKYFLLFAVVHAIYLAILLVFLLLAPQPLAPLKLLMGIIAYAPILIMPLFQHLAYTGRWSLQNFRTYEMIFIYYVWFVFFMTYLMRVEGRIPDVGGTYKQQVMLLAWVSMMLGYKLSSQITFRMKR
jgi:hypothetical protein